MSAEVNGQSGPVPAHPEVNPQSGPVPAHTEVNVEPPRNARMSANVAPSEVNVQPPVTASAPTAVKGATNVNASFKPPNKVHYCINIDVINLYGVGN
jgi:hypothetical protein